MESGKRAGESARHLSLKRLTLLWAQAQGYTACALEVSLPKCRYRADVVGYRPAPNEATAIFECKRDRTDLRRDNCCSSATRQRLETVQRRRAVLEKHLRVHYPSLRIADSLFPEFDSHNFAAIDHRTYARVLRDLEALQNRLYDCRKFETLVRYRSANLFFLVMPQEIFRASEVPIGWGALLESEGRLLLACKPSWYEVNRDCTHHFLHRIAGAGTRVLNGQLNITFEEVQALRRSQPFAELPRSTVK